jgi:hypothetical protein
VGKSKVHPGFHNAAQGIAAQEHVPRKEADAMLAASARHASKAALRKNPHLKRVGKKK